MRLLVIAICLGSFLFAKEQILVFHAGSLAVPFANLAQAFEKKYPHYAIKREVSGSVVAARKVTELGRAVDIVASADYEVIDRMLIPKHAKFNAYFATNEMVLAYTPSSAYAAQIDSDNWIDILLKKDVKVGHANPNLDPCGYRTMLSVKLAEKFYQKDDLFTQLFGYGKHYKVGDEKRSKVVVRPKETDLLALLQINAIDYLFIYKSVAKQHGLEYVQFPPQISLGDVAYASEYATVSFDIAANGPNSFVTQAATPMVYALTIVQNAKSPRNEKGAVKFVEFVLSKQGLQIVKQSAQTPIEPPVVKGDATILK
ncbi:MAG: tungstate ABC transporter substrate-binding protein WtpA [Campylobacterota bacterium]